MRIPIDTIAPMDDVQAARPAGHRLDDIQVASPCTVGWNRMAGDDRLRFCPQCSQNVYNLSAMTAAEATALLERKPCVRFYRRRDGTVMTADCPVGVRQFARLPWRWAAIALAAVFPAAMALVGWGGRQQQACMGKPASPPTMKSLPAPAAVNNPQEHPSRDDDGAHAGKGQRPHG